MSAEQTTEMELRVAKALFDPPHPQATFDTMPATVRDYQIERARRAIRAMREPTQDMASAAGTLSNAGFSGYGIYQTMIDVASPATEP